MTFYVQKKSLISEICLFVFLHWTLREDENFLDILKKSTYNLEWKPNHSYDKLKKNPSCDERWLDKSFPDQRRSISRFHCAMRMKVTDIFWIGHRSIACWYQAWVNYDNVDNNSCGGGGWGGGLDNKMFLE